MKIPDSKENAEMCICSNCPTHNNCMKEKNEKLFCARGKSACELIRQGCICGECPVASRYKLNDLYFCDKGQAK